jgi:predicted phage terminase large subunit-like protein
VKSCDRLDELDEPEFAGGLALWHQHQHLADFARRAWQELEARPCIWSWHLDLICSALEMVTRGELRRLVVCVPPRMSKSTIVSVIWPAWHWLHHPDSRLLVTSAVESVVFRDAMRMHDLCDTRWYRKLAPRWEWSDSQDAKGYYVQSLGGARASKTVGQRLQGIDADGLIVDDPLDTRDATPSRVALAEHVQWFDERATQRMTSEDAWQVLIMQRLHEAELAGHLIERGWPALILPAIREAESGVTVPGLEDPRAPGEILCARLSHDYLAERRVALGERGFSAQYQQRPAPAEGAVFRKEWLRFWDAVTLPQTYDYTMLSVDTTFRAGRSNDYCCGQVWGVVGANCYLLDQFRKRMGFDDTLAEILAMHDRHPGLRATVIEAQATGLAVAEALKARVPGVVTVSHQGESKESRAEAVTPRFAAGQVYLPHPHTARWVERFFLPELLGFPVARHDDQVDTMTQALIWISRVAPVMPMMIRL